MTQNSALEALTVDGKFLLDFSVIACRPTWEAWRQAKQKLDAAGGHFSLTEQRARLHRNTRRSSFVDYHPYMDDDARPQRIAVANEDEREKLNHGIDQAWHTLKQAVCAALRNCMYTVRAIPKDSHHEIDLPKVLQQGITNIDLRKSTITVGRRRFEYVRVFSVASQPMLAAGEVVQPQPALVKVPDGLTPGETAVHVAVVALFPGGVVPTGLRAKERDELIENYLKNGDNLSSYGTGTIKRYLAKMNKTVR